MKDSNSALRKAYYDSLAGITIDGIEIPRYDSYADDDAPAYYILLSNDDAQDAGTKTSFGTTSYMTIQVVTKFTGVRGGSYICDRIVNEVLGRVMPASTADYIDLSPDFKLVTTVLSNNRPSTLDTGIEKIYSRILGLKHLIVEL